MENNLKIQGFVLLDVDVVALNNGGADTSSNYDNAVKTKSIYKNGENYVYVSGQAWRYWWRNTLQKDLGWTLSPVTRDKNIAFTNADPIRYPDDDIFGYMRAATEEYEEKGKKKSRNITVTRVSPLKNSALVSVASVHPAANWSSMSRQDGDSVPYKRQEYSAVMKGMFSLDADMAGTFSDYNRSGYKNLSESLKEFAMTEGGNEIVDPFGSGKLIRLPLQVRQQRVSDTILALKNISGGAMQTNNLGDVTPKLIILATTVTGNHPFSHIVMGSGDRNEKAVLNVKGLKEVIDDYSSTFRGKIFIGKRSGFFDEYDQELAQLASDHKDMVELGPVNQSIEHYVLQIKQQMES
ncbi:type I-B CRISPR-associated protein Cas7/Cst2/DevR [Prevotella cerevisiae]|jgi:CRISPR-associated protein Cst2|uniref:Type I-B CRISPR-associated protein Cas7/Cst2/DevR n=1 Tax=Segatella cerevisiae TaxID=2053716 RepID=A0ABT1BTD3_9BACT|nr:type I-B CRISPR-associated protein Cas7/Cst2/DevR [Segatella cerevisiae]MCO6024338.1 type I-B CRISPR-associated protein Cas7/Cst2/DevR [Segatella cerevisiae]